jgi:hypothetical protein
MGLQRCNSSRGFVTGHAIRRDLPDVGDLASNMVELGLKSWSLHAIFLSKKQGAFYLVKVNGSRLISCFCD